MLLQIVADVDRFFSSLHEAIWNGYEPPETDFFLKKKTYKGDQAAKNIFFSIL